MNKKLDLFGIFIFGFVTSIGGGTLRDMMIGKTPVSWTQDFITIYAIIGATLFATLFKSKVIRLKNTLFLFDTIGLGIFTITGVKMGIKYELHPIISIMLGTITGAFGGLIRDILSNDIPVILRKEVYASACIAGGITYFFFDYFFSSEEIASIIAVLIVISIRILAVKFHWQLPNIYSKK